MGDNYFLLTNLLSEDEQKIITSIAAHLERGENGAAFSRSPPKILSPPPPS